MKKWTNTILLFASILVALVIAELLLRIFMPEIGWAQREESILGWSSDEYKQFDVTEVPESRAVKRVLFLGDSCLAGSGVSDLDKRFPVQLEKLLDHRITSRILAAGGWGTDQELLAFKQKGKFWEPDLVFLVFYAYNDISNILSHHHEVRNLKPYFAAGENNALELFDAYGAPIDYGKLFNAGEAGREGTGVSARSYLFDYLRYVFSNREDEQGFFKSRNDENRQRRPDYHTGEFQAVDERYKKFLVFSGEKRRKKLGEISKGLDQLTWSPQKSVNEISAYIHDDFAINTYQWKLFELILGELNREVESAGGQLVVLLLPDIFNTRDMSTITRGKSFKIFKTPKGSFTFRSDEPRERLRDITERTGILFFDPTSAFIKQVEGKGLMNKVWPRPNNDHFSELGHAILADLLKQYIKSIIEAPDKDGKSYS